MAILTREEAIELYQEEVVIQAESLEYGIFEINLMLCDCISNAYYGNWTTAIDKYKELNILSPEIEMFIDALEDNGDNESMKTLVMIGFYARA